MRQHRRIALLVAIAAALAIPATGAAAPADPVHGPACGDIVLSDPDQSGPPVYSGTEGGTATVYALVSTEKPSCTGLVYTFSVYDASGTTLLDSQTASGDGVTSSFSFTYTTTDAPQNVCVTATSSRGGHVIDAAPNSGCFVLALNASGGQSGIN